MAIESSRSYRVRESGWALALTAIACLTHPARAADKKSGPPKEAATPAAAKAPDAATPAAAKAPDAQKSEPADPTIAPGPPDETKDAARSMAREALSLMHEGRWLEAQSMLARAYRLVPAPTIAVLEGRALEQMGKLTEAKARYEVAANVPADEPTDAFREAASDARERLRRLEHRIPHLSVVLERDPHDPRKPVVTLDGAILEEREWTVPRAVNPGEHVVVASIDGRAAVEDHILLKEADSKQVLLRLHGGEATTPAVPRAPSAPADAGNSTRTWGYVALGVGGIGLGTGVVAGLMMLDAKSILDDACRPGCPPRVEGDLSRFRTTRWVSTVGYGAGIVGLGVGAALLLFAPPSTKSPETGAVRIGGGLGSAYVEGSF